MIRSPAITFPECIDSRELDDVFGTVLAMGSPDQRRRVTLDLSNVTFMAPAGLTGVVLCACRLRELGWEPSVRFPTADNVTQYLRRMGLRKALRGRARCIGAPSSPHRYGPTTALIELTTIEESRDVNALLGWIAEGIGGILEEELRYTRSDVGSFANVISELAANIIDHSATVGFVAAQRYTARRGEKYALISVGDAGVGLRATLGERYPVSEWTDAEILSRALLPQYSRHQGRGLGLALVKKVCQDYRGSLHFRSGTCRLYLRGRRALQVEVAPFPGTQIAISLQEKAR